MTEDTKTTTETETVYETVRGAVTKRLRVQGFIIFADYIDRYSEFAEQLGQWVRQGKIRFLEDIVEGIEQAPQAFIGLLEGKNFGKLIVRVNGE
jgi:NADPH-dependent curcumin reductase